MKKNLLDNADTNNGINAPQLVEKSTIIAQILGYSPPSEARQPEPLTSDGEVAL